MSKKILVTDSLFIGPAHVATFEAAGYQVERLDTPELTEQQLIAALKGKIAYIIGGLEKVTEAVIEAGKDLRVIAYTGTDWKSAIPGWQAAERIGVKIVDTPHANAAAVAEFSVAVGLSMQRNLFEISRTGTQKFFTSLSFQGATIGILGAGAVGTKIMQQASTFSPARVFVLQPHPKRL